MPGPNDSFAAKIDTSTPNVARVYDALLDGKDNFEVDRSVVARFLEQQPDADRVPKENRKWLGRVVRWLAGTGGIDQFLDAGSGLPTVENTHQVAQRINPDARVVYVDNNPVVIAHGRALLDDNDRTVFSAADLTDPDALFADPAVRDHLELDRPIALLQCATFHFVAEPTATEAMARYYELLPSGSYLALTHMLLPEPGDPAYEPTVEGIDEYRRSVTPDYTPRTIAELHRLFTGFELTEPGIVPLAQWWPDGPQVSPASDFVLTAVGGVGRKP